MRVFYERCGESAAWFVYDGDQPLFYVQQHDVDIKLPLYLNISVMDSEYIVEVRSVGDTSPLNLAVDEGQ